MKVKDIKVGSHYAEGSPSSGYHSRVEVLEVGPQPRDGRYGGTPKGIRVRIQHVNTQTGAVPERGGYEQWTALTNITMPWADYENVLVSKATAEAEKAQRLTIRQAKAAVLEDLLMKALDATSKYSVGVNAYNGTVTLSFGQIERLLGATV